MIGRALVADCGECAETLVENAAGALTVGCEVDDFKPVEPNRVPVRKIPWSANSCTCALTSRSRQRNSRSVNRAVSITSRSGSITSESSRR